MEGILRSGSTGKILTISLLLPVQRLEFQSTLDTSISIVAISCPVKEAFAKNDLVLAVWIEFFDLRSHSRYHGSRAANLDLWSCIGLLMI